MESDSMAWGGGWGLVVMLFAKSKIVHHSFIKGILILVNVLKHQSLNFQ